MPPYKRGAVQHVVDYPTGDGKPVGETPTHRDNLLYLIEMLRDWYARNDDVYVSGSMFLYYEEGNKHKHVSPDVFVVQGVPKAIRIRYYATWEQEGRGLDLVIEVTSPKTQKEDTEKKFRLYQKVLRVPEYFLFDPFAEYLKPPLQGYQLKRGRYVRIKPVQGRLPSETTGLHLEQNGEELRLYDPNTKVWVPNPREKAARARTEVAQAQIEAARAQTEAARAQTEAAQAQAVLAQAEAENARLRQELEALRRTSGQA
jgi:Uma2 family endonuclease